MIKQHSKDKHKRTVFWSTADSTTYLPRTCYQLQSVFVIKVLNHHLLTFGIRVNTNIKWRAFLMTILNVWLGCKVIVPVQREVGQTGQIVTFSHINWNCICSSTTFIYKLLDWSKTPLRYEWGSPKQTQTRKCIALTLCATLV